MSRPLELGTSALRQAVSEPMHDMSWLHGRPLPLAQHAQCSHALRGCPAPPCCPRCPSSHGTESAGACLLYAGAGSAAPDPSGGSVWTSGFKYASDAASYEQQQQPQEEGKGQCGRLCCLALCMASERVWLTGRSAALWCPAGVQRMQPAILYCRLPQAPLKQKNPALPCAAGPSPSPASTNTPSSPAAPPSSPAAIPSSPAALPSSPANAPSCQQIDHAYVTGNFLR